MNGAPRYPVGSFFTTTVTGRVGFLIALGQLLCGKPSAYMHAGLIVSSFGDTVEGQPGGARFGHVDTYKAQGRPLLIGDPVAWWAATHPGVDVQALREQVALEGDRLRGTPYSPLDYLALAMLHWHIPAAGWVRRRVESSGHLICSALVDRALTRAGIHLFAGRLSGDVMPADLADLADTWKKVAA